MKLNLRVASVLAAMTLSACAGARFESEPKGPNTAEVSVLFEVSSARSVVLGGVFDEGRECRNYRMTNVDGRSTPRYEMRVRAETLTMVFLSAGEFTGSLTYGGTGKKCGGTYSFDPKAGSQYQVVFRDEPERCGVSLAEVVNGRGVDLSHRLVARDAKETVPGSSRCADIHVPR